MTQIFDNDGSVVPVTVPAIVAVPVNEASTLVNVPRVELKPLKVTKSELRLKSCVWVTVPANAPADAPSNSEAATAVNSFCIVVP